MAGYTEYFTLKETIEKNTGFECYEDMPGGQLVFYGTSDKFEDFKTLIGKTARTGSIAYLMDTDEKKMYSKYKNEWL